MPHRSQSIRAIGPAALLPGALIKKVNVLLNFLASSLTLIVMKPWEMHMDAGVNVLLVGRHESCCWGGRNLEATAP
jgi:hypothetical protein